MFYQHNLMNRADSMVAIFHHFSWILMIFDGAVLLKGLRVMAAPSAYYGVALLLQYTIRVGTHQIQP